jgi:hypothetical protein
MLAEMSAPRGFDTRLATVGYIVRGLLDNSSPNHHTSQGTANGMAGPVEWCSPDNHTCSFMSRPLVERVRWNHTTSQAKCVTERRLIGGSLRHSVDGFRRDRAVFGPGRDQAPANQIKRSPRRSTFLPDDWNHLRGRDVPAGRPARICIQTEIVPQVSFAVGR